MIGEKALKTIASTITSPTVRNQAVLKSGKDPNMSPKLKNYSLRFALVISKRKAELKNCTMKVIVVI